MHGLTLVHPFAGPALSHETYFVCVHYSLSTAHPSSPHGMVALHSCEWSHFLLLSSTSPHRPSSTAPLPTSASVFAAPSDTLLRPRLSQLARPSRRSGARGFAAPECAVRDAAHERADTADAARAQRRQRGDAAGAAGGGLHRPRHDTKRRLVHLVDLPRAVDRVVHGAAEASAAARPGCQGQAEVGRQPRGGLPLARLEA
eukprot:6179850-Pleurochrysis_carterae.AAC.5